MNGLLKWWPVVTASTLVIIAGAGWIVVAADAHQKARELYSYIEKQRSCEDLCDALDKSGDMRITYEECVRKCRQDREEDEDDGG